MGIPNLAFKFTNPCRSTDRSRMHATMSTPQQTLAQSVSDSGISLHTGEVVNLSILPGEPNTGIRFRRVDLPGMPEVQARVSNVSDLLRNTTLESGAAKVSTVEHVMSALHGLAIDNAVVELDGGEPPIFDGSAQRLVEMILSAGIVQQSNPRQSLSLESPVSVMEGDRILIALPHEGFRISCTFADERGRMTQYFSVDVDPEQYVKQIAPARTFTFAEDIESLVQQGKIKGGSIDAAIVIKGETILSKEPLRFQDEFVRHKILDIVGDIALLSCPLRAHIVAIKPGHAINSKLTQKLAELLA